MRKTQTWVAGIDGGGTKIRFSAFADTNQTKALSTIEVPVSGNYAKDRDGIVTASRELSSRHGTLQNAGVALAGKVNEGRTELTAAGNIHHFVGVPVVDDLSNAFGCAVALGNDAEAAALAEAYYGHGKNSDFWLMIWGTGVGGALVRHAKGNTFAFPGEPGHQIVDPESTRLCGCKQYGCLEAHCGGKGIANHYGVPAEQLEPIEWEQVVYWMAQGIQKIVASQPVPLVVFSGGIANKQPHLLERTRRALGHDLRIVDLPVFKLSVFGEAAGTVGALALVRNK